jgi:hypothetical protein
VTKSIPHLLSNRETRVILVKRIGKSIHLNEFDAREPFVVSVSQRSEELQFKNSGLKMVSSNASPGQTIRFMFDFFSEVGDGGFLKEVIKTYLIAPIPALNSPTFFSVIISIVYEMASIEQNVCILLLI